MENNSTCPICRKQLEGAERASTSIPAEVSYDPDMYAMEVQYRMGHLHRCVASDESSHTEGQLWRVSDLSCPDFVAPKD